MSQPALSMQIHELEGFLGGHLVERLQGDVILTERGMRIAERAALILSAARDLVEFAHHSNRVLAGPLRLGVIPTIAPYVLPHVIPALRRSYPDLCLTVVETHTKALLSELTRGNVDLVLLALPTNGAEVDTLDLFEDRFLLAVNVDDPLSERARVTKSDVEQRTLLLLEEGHCLRDQALAFCAGAHNAATTCFFASSLTTIMQMVANGYGSTLLPEVAVNAELRDTRVKLLRFSPPYPHRRVGLAWRRTSPRQPDFHAFGKLVVDALSPTMRVEFTPTPSAPTGAKTRLGPRAAKPSARDQKYAS